MSGFRIGKTSVPDEGTRSRLQRAILDNDAASFRETLAKELPDIAHEHRLYGVLEMGPDGMHAIVVDQNGRRISDPRYVIPPGTPIDLLNVVYEGTKMIVTTPSGDTWSAEASHLYDRD
jgi:hypothetical protein